MLEDLQGFSEPPPPEFLERIGRTPERLAGVEFEVVLPQRAAVMD